MVHWLIGLGLKRRLFNHWHSWLLFESRSCSLLRSFANLCNFVLVLDDINLPLGLCLYQHIIIDIVIIKWFICRNYCCLHRSIYRLRWRFLLFWLCNILL